MARLRRIAGAQLPATGADAGLLGIVPLAGGVALRVRLRDAR
jgi:hypothetical protein